MDRALGVYLGVVAVYGGYSFLLKFSLWSWEHLFLMSALYIFMLVMAVFLWQGKRLGLEMAKVFYFAQIATSLGFGSLVYDLDGGLKLAFGWMSGDFRFSLLFFHTNFYIGFLDLESERSLGMVLNAFAIVMAFYYLRRLTAARSPQYCL
jgi:hypothetical protein